MSKETQHKAEPGGSLFPTLIREGHPPSGEKPGWIVRFLDWFYPETKIDTSDVEEELAEWKRRIEKRRASRENETNPASAAESPNDQQGGQDRDQDSSTPREVLRKALIESERRFIVGSDRPNLEGDIFVRIRKVEIEPELRPTPAQKQVQVLISAGYSLDEIADEMGIDEEEVMSHVGAFGETYEEIYRLCRVNQRIASDLLECMGVRPEEIYRAEPEQPPEPEIDPEDEAT